MSHSVTGPLESVLLRHLLCFLLYYCTTIPLHASSPCRRKKRKKKKKREVFPKVMLTKLVCHLSIYLPVFALLLLLLFSNWINWLRAKEISMEISTLVFFCSMTYTYGCLQTGFLVLVFPFHFSDFFQFWLPPLSEKWRWRTMQLIIKPFFSVGTKE